MLTAENTCSTQDLESELSKLIDAFEGFVKRITKDNVLDAQERVLSENNGLVGLYEKTLSLARRVLSKNGLSNSTIISHQRFQEENQG